LREADLSHANLSGADLSYTDLTGASLREANLAGTVLYPAETSKAKFCGAKFTSDSDAADYARIAQAEMWRRMRIKPGSVAYAKLRRINGSRSVPEPTAPAYNWRERAQCFVESIILRVLAVTVGTAYFLSTFYLVASVPELTNIHVAIGWYGTAFGQMLIGLIFVGIGLGVISIKFGKEKRSSVESRAQKPSLLLRPAHLIGSK
jgi:hypothetical protein